MKLVVKNELFEIPKGCAVHGAAQRSKSISKEDSAEGAPAVNNLRCRRKKSSTSSKKLPAHPSQVKQWHVHERPCDRLLLLNALDLTWAHQLPAGTLRKRRPITPPESSSSSEGEAEDQERERHQKAWSSQEQAFGRPSLSTQSTSTSTSADMSCNLPGSPPSTPCNEKSKPIQWTPPCSPMPASSPMPAKPIQWTPGKACLTRWADEESSDADEYVKNEVSKTSGAATIGEKMFTELCASSSHTNGMEYTWPDTESDDDQIYGSAQALSVPYALPLTTLRPIEAAPECCIALAAAGRTKLSSKASLFKPIFGSTAAAISSSPSELSRLVSAIKRCILSMESTLDLHVAEHENSSDKHTTTTITANFAAGGDAAARLDGAIKMVQGAVLEEASHLEEIVLVGSEDHPFKDFPSWEGGFSMAVARVPASERAFLCRRFLKDGICNRQSGTCRWYHPTESDLAAICVEFLFE